MLTLGEGAAADRAGTRAVESSMSSCRRRGRRAARRDGTARRLAGSGAGRTLRPEPQPSARAPNGPPPAASPTVRKIARELGIDLRRVRGSERGRPDRHGRPAPVHPAAPGSSRAGTRPRGSRSSAAPAPKPAPASIDFSKWGPSKQEDDDPPEDHQPEDGRSRGPPSRTSRSSTRPTSRPSWRCGRSTTPAYEKKGARLTLTAFALPRRRRRAEEASALQCEHRRSGRRADRQSSTITSGSRWTPSTGSSCRCCATWTRRPAAALGRAERWPSRARDRKLALEEMQGGTFTISNQGGIGSGHLHADHQHAGGRDPRHGPRRGEARRARGQGRASARCCRSALSYDHRIIDGANAARFMVDLVAAFEQFDEARCSKI